MKNYLGIVAVILLMACNNSANKSASSLDSSATKTDTVQEVKTVFKDPKLETIFTAYVSLKDALVATKIEEAKTAAKVLAHELRNYTGCENTSIIATRIENAKDIVSQRKDFTAVSSDVIALFKHAEFSSGSIYVQHCPMANNGDGGDWLSSSHKIQNPYYGTEMMECGAVTDEIKAK